MWIIGYHFIQTVPQNCLSTDAVLWHNLEEFAFMLPTPLYCSCSYVCIEVKSDLQDD